MRKFIFLTFLKLRIRVFILFNSNNPQFSEIIRILIYFQKNSLCVFPYSFTAKYHGLIPIVSQIDGFPVIHFQNRRLFLNPKFSDSHAISYFRSISIEQDPESPHLYLTDDFNLKGGETVLDIGAAEGNFSLQVLGLADEILIFESSPEWYGALRRTFQPWSNKVKIFNRKVGELVKADCLSIDSLDNLKDKDLFIKIDVDGSEFGVLKGMEGLLKRHRSIRLVICTYHNQNDAAKFENYLNGFGFKTHFSAGYMLYVYDRKQKAPFLRKGILRAELNRC